MSRRSGRWVIDREHGQQFKADELKTTHPASAEGIEKYLASGAIRSIGPKLAAKIVAVYKERTLEIFEQAPDFLLHIKGIGQERLQRIRQSWEEQKEVRKIMLFLTEHGITSGRAVRIYRTYGHEVHRQDQGEPVPTGRRHSWHRLQDGRRTGGQAGHRPQQSVPGEGGGPVHAARLGRRRDTAAIPSRASWNIRSSWSKSSRQIVEEAVRSVVQDGSVIREVVDGEPWLYLASLYRAEVGLAQSVHRIASATPHPLPRIDVEKAIAWVEQRLGIQLAAAQQEAIRQACQHKLLVITGGPGVGKTTLVRSILEIFSAKELKCVLAAPTGRAAKRLAETTGRTAKTVHRLLEFDPATGEFKRNQQHPLTGDLFVLDETSMVDVVLGHQVLRAIPSEACVILVGDVDQLPSVGPGSVLADLIASNVVPVVRLTEIFRQASQSRIITAAYAINHGQMPKLSTSEELTDFYFVEAEEPEAIQDMLVRLVKERIPARFGFDPKSDIQVLTPMNRSLLGSQKPQPSAANGAQSRRRRSRSAAVRLDVSDRRSGDPEREQLQPGRVQRRLGDRREDQPHRAGDDGQLRGPVRRVRFRRSRRVGAGLRAVDPQEPGFGVSLRRHSIAHAALPDAATEPALHGGHERQEARGPGGNEEGVGHGRAPGGYRAEVHGVEEAAARDWNGALT